MAEGPELSYEISEPDPRRKWDPVRLKQNGPGMGQALTSRARTPATQHQWPSHLVASTLRAVEHVAPKVWRHLVPCEARIVGGGSCCVLKAQLFPVAACQVPKNISHRLCGFQHHKEGNLLCFLVSGPRRVSLKKKHHQK